MALEKGDFLNKRYRILEILGHGGMGAVYRALDESLGVEVAVKENLFVTEDFAAQFKREAIILAGLRHPNIPRVTDHFVMPGQGQYLVMDFISGNDLRQTLEKAGKIAEPDVVHVGISICEALQYLHTRTPPILHRDLKLGNIKIAEDGTPYLVDFGLAKMAPLDQATMTGARAMTPGYSPPEQYGSARTDARSDVYALGATLYAALTGFIPEDSLARVMDGVSLTPLRQRTPEVSENLAYAIEKAMSTQPANRYQSAEEFRRALLGQEATPPVLGTSPVAPRTARAGALSPRLILFSLFAIIVFVVLLVAGLPDRGLFLAPTPRSSATPSPILVAPAASATASQTSLPPTFTSVPPTSDSFAATVLPLTPVIPTALPFSPTPHGPQIAFAMMDGPVAQIFLAELSGGLPTRLTYIPDGACQPTWSPDGQKIVFISPCDRKRGAYSNAGLFLLDVQTGDVEPLLDNNDSNYDPAWSPDGASIAFTSTRDGHPQIYLFSFVDLSTPLRRLTNTASTVEASQPAWSPDGKSIVYTVRRVGLQQIWRMDPDGANPDQFLRSGEAYLDSFPVFSVDGAFIFFSRTQRAGGSPLAVLMRWAPGLSAPPAQLSPAPPVVDIDLAPDGFWLAYEGSDGINQDVYLFNLQDGSILRLTSANEPDFDPAWRP